MAVELKITEQDLTVIRDGIYQIASTKDSDQTFEYCYDKGDYYVIMDVTYTFETKEVRGGSFEYWNGYVEYERCSEITDEHYTIESLSAFYEDEELEVPNNFIQKAEYILNN